MMLNQAIKNKVLAVPNTFAVFRKEDGEIIQETVAMWVTLSHKDHNGYLYEGIKGVLFPANTNGEMDFPRNKPEQGITFIGYLLPGEDLDKKFGAVLEGFNAPV